MTDDKGSSVPQAMLDNDAFIKAASVGDTVVVGSTTQTVTKKQFSESNEIVVRYFAEIFLANNTTYKTSQPFSGNEYLALLEPGNHVKIGSNTYVVTNTEFVKEANGAQLRKVNWRPAV
ncbi:hypothetical protein MO767_14350 [Pseudomonas sp. UYIF39]|uniref:hypothetical protein n=1 Tax=Pseudomonas sp. UYIF39 TaxID=1630747 RepID=UPI00249F0533|nr:hypothetical protein [Pseudomonas sp. UYIF39]MDI3355526.1 hypothetical protein [Pseudomonas sp. UYIF39]